jgi:predicted RND superfamily exporter protein
MDTEIYTALIISIIFLALLYVFDEGALLIIFGLIVALIGIKFTTLFTIGDTDIIIIMRLVYGVIAVSAIGKSMYMRKEILEAH